MSGSGEPNAGHPNCYGAIILFTKLWRHTQSADGDWLFIHRLSKGNNFIPRVISWAGYSVRESIVSRRHCWSGHRATTSVATRMLKYLTSHVMTVFCRVNTKSSSGYILYRCYNMLLMRRRPTNHYFLMKASEGELASASSLHKHRAGRAAATNLPRKLREHHNNKSNTLITPLH